MLAGSLSVKLVSSESKGHYTLNRISLESINEQESDSVLLYHYTAWPRHATPNDGTEGVYDMLQQVMRSKSNQQVDTVRKLLFISCHLFFSNSPNLVMYHNEIMTHSFFLSLWLL